ncbi:MAG: hypothetical protein NXI04_28540 [Planctomycetaceae bacterium]|nr:hypothetical protein [Planctomycetaceae bacterium]
MCPVFRIAFTLCVLPALTADEPSSVFTSGDFVVLRSDVRSSRISGRIEDIKGETVTLLRSNRAKVEVFRCRDLAQLHFGRPLDWARGREQWEAGNQRRGLELFDRAINSELRPWARNELLAESARFCLQAGKFEQALQRIERVFAKDPQTRHVALLPLVWDERLPDSERISVPRNDIDSDSVVRQLVACSVWLHSSDHREAVVSRLTSLRRTSGNSRLSELAGTQLWRDGLLHQSSDLTVPDHYRDIVSQLPADARGGAAFVLGRLLARRHQYDDAALLLMWMPLMSHNDRALAAASLAESIRCLRLGGRLPEAARLQQDLQSRFPGTSAAQAAESGPDG